MNIGISSDDVVKNIKNRINVPRHYCEILCISCEAEVSVCGGGDGDLTLNLVPNQKDTMVSLLN